MQSHSNNPDEERRKINEVYTRLNEEGTANYLEDMDKKTICNTPIHEAAAAGMTHLALEVANLKPSLARKLNLEGLSPMHLALHHGHVQTVRALMAFDPGLIRVKGRDLVTPLHYAAEIEETELLAEFLSACPSSIEDLTSRCETAMHVAVRNKSVKACKVLFGWMRRMDLEEILNWKDEDGNNVLHIATITNQPEVMKLVIRDVKVNAKNFHCLTALDIYHGQGNPHHEQVEKILRGAKAKRASEVKDFMTGADYLSRAGLTLMEWRNRTLGLTNGHRRANSANDQRNIILVVAVLIATATYQSMLSPPGGYWQDTPAVTSTAATTNCHTLSPTIAATPTPTAVASRDGDIEPPPHMAGQMIISGLNLNLFFGFNSAALVASMTVIVILLDGLPLSSLLITSGFYLLISYFTAFWSNIGDDGDSSLWNCIRLLLLLFVGMMYTVPLLSYIRFNKLKSQLDIPGRRIGGFI